MFKVDEWERLRLIQNYESLPDTRREAAIALIGILGKIGPNALEMLLDVARGHEIGLPYGDWDNSARDYVTDGKQEGRDGINYCSAEMRRLAAVIKARSHFAAAHAALSEAHESSRSK